MGSTLDDPQRLARVTVRWTEMIADDLPAQFKQALSTAVHRWHDGSADQLLDLAVPCWSWLDAKGSGSIVRDGEDRAVRMLIGCLVDEPDLEYLDMWFEFAVRLMVDSGVAPEDLKRVFDETD